MYVSQIIKYQYVYNKNRYFFAQPHSTNLSILNSFLSLGIYLYILEKYSSLTLFYCFFVSWMQYLFFLIILLIPFEMSTSAWSVLCPSGPFYFVLSSFKLEAWCSLNV